MVQFAGTTYRVVRDSPGVYRLVRIVDDLEVGVFRPGPPLRVVRAVVAPELVHEIALVALRHAKTTWTGATGRTSSEAEIEVVDPLDSVLAHY